MAVFLGIDVGGSKTAFACVSFPLGEIRQHAVMATPPKNDTGRGFLAAVAGQAAAMIADSERAGETVAGIGLGLCELVSPQGRITSDHRITWTDQPVDATLAALRPLTIESDVRAAALAEARLGAGLGSDPLYYLNIGTGISGCLVLGGVPNAGALGNAIVVGSTPGQNPCPNCGCDCEKSLEDRYGGAGLVAAYREGGQTATSALDVLAAAASGDRDAATLVSVAADAIGTRLGAIIDLLDPAAIVVGGGIAAADSPFWSQLVQAARRQIWSPDTRRLPILKAALGARSGVVGAAAAASIRHLASAPSPSSRD